MPRLSGREKFSPGTFEQLAPGLRSSPDRFDPETSALTMRPLGLHFMKTSSFNNVRFRNQVTQMNPRYFTI